MTDSAAEGYTGHADNQGIDMRWRKSLGLLRTQALGLLQHSGAESRWRETSKFSVEALSIETFKSMLLRRPVGGPSPKVAPSLAQLGNTSF